MKSGDTLIRRLPVGAEVQPGGGVHFRVWAPRRKRVDVVLLAAGSMEADRTSPSHRPQAEGDGCFSGFVARATAGLRCRYRLDGDACPPDPASRFQPDGPHGPSQVVDPETFRWADQSWRGARLEGQVMYEMHVGTFTPEGTWVAAARELPELAAAGITVVELMPVADFPGRFGWGYDGVDLFAPTRLYGTPAFDIAPAPGGGPPNNRLSCFGGINVEAHGDVLAYVRRGRTGESTFLVALNRGANPHVLHRPADASEGTIALSTHLDRGGENVRGAITLRANEGVVVRLPD